MKTVAPLGSLRFQASPRRLPQVKSIQLGSSDKHNASFQHILENVSQHVQQGVSTLDILLETHNGLQAQLTKQGSPHVKVTFAGIDTGDITVSVAAVRSCEEASITGLESTAVLGKGWGISPFQSRSPEVPSLLSEAASDSVGRTGKSLLGLSCGQAVV